MASPFLNIDAGELEGEPELLYALAHLVNVACGGHAGDEASMRRVLAFCKQFGTRVGAHPSYPDREGFGRRPMAMRDAALASSIREQCRALAAVASSAGAVSVGYVKLHGALYHAANADPAIARAALGGAVEALGRVTIGARAPSRVTIGARAPEQVTVIGPPTGAMALVAREMELAYAREGFADRGVRDDGSLIPRGEAGAMIDDPAHAAARATELAASGTVETICVHGDGKNALAVARAVRAALDGAP